MTTTTRHNYGMRLRAERTLAQMRANVLDACSKPHTWETARTIVADVAERDQATQAQAIRAWMAARFRYVNDPVRVELLETPGYLLARIARDGFTQGDCDAAASLAAALCSAVGIPVELWAVAFKPGQPYAHVFAVATPKRGGGPVEMDVTRPAGVAMPKQFSRTLRLPV